MVPVTLDFAVVNCEPTVTVLFILLPFVVVVSVTLSDIEVRIKIREVLGQYGHGGSNKSCHNY